MNVRDPGHRFDLALLDQKEWEPPFATITYVKREGPGYPGNVGSYSGTTLQESWRAEIARLKYLNAQVEHPYNTMIIGMLRSAISLLETRAAVRHGRRLPGFQVDVESMITCPKCLHIGCDGSCRSHNG